MIFFNAFYLYQTTSMNRMLLLLTVCLLSCGQHLPIAEKNHTQAPVIDEEAALLAEKKASLEQLFLLNRDSASFSQQEMGASLLIGHLFDSTHKDAVFRYQENDSIASVYVLRQTDRKWDTIFSVRHAATSGGAFDTFVEISDFNGDQIPDLKVVREFWEMRVGETADLWLYANNHFTPVQGFDSIVSATYDENTHLIYSYHSNGCADMAMYFGVFKIVGKELKPVQEMNCNCCLDDSCSIEIVGKEPYMVPYKEAYKHVPVFYAEAVKEKCE